MKSHNNLHPQVCSLENVMAAARFHARGETHAVRLHEELTTGTWQPGKYTYFDIHEPKLRRVAAAPFRDRVVHHALVRSMPLETQLVFSMELFLHRCEFSKIEEFKRLAGTHRQIQEFLEDLNLTDPKSFDTAFDTAFSFSATDMAFFSSSGLGERVW